MPPPPLLLQVRPAQSNATCKTFYWNGQPTSVYVRDTHVSLPDAVPDGTTQSEQLRLLAIFDGDQQDQLAHAVYTMTVPSETTACHCHMAAI
jgi:hypothetical protein